MSRRPEIDGVLAACPGVKIGQTVGIPHDTLGEMVVTASSRKRAARSRNRRSASF